MIHHLRAAGVSVILDGGGTQVPSILHWGADLGDLGADGLQALAATRPRAVAPSAVDDPMTMPLVPTKATAWTGVPGLSGWFADGAPLGVLACDGVTSTGASSLRVELSSSGAVGGGAAGGGAVGSGAGRGDSAGIGVTIDIELTETGVLRLRQTLVNRGAAPFAVGSLASILPIPDRARELLDFSGTWSHERRPQRSTVRHGVWSRETRHGRPGHDDPFLLAAGTPGFGFRSGELWAVHLGWSGDKRLWIDSEATGQTVLGAAELLDGGEVVLAPGEEYASPWTFAVWSGEGIDGISARLHPWVRRALAERPGQADGPRPLLVNTWEAVYFDHDHGRLDELAAAASRVGVERFVLDDGWFTGRRDDTKALGDWQVDRTVWPEGLHPLIANVAGRGMSFGLWVEPEMVSPDSEIARAHPDWILGASVPGSSANWRYQQVLDLGNEDAHRSVLADLTALLDEYPISYLKWDHNRDVLAGSVHRQTTALYRLLAALRSRYPDLEIESCASGGARIDLGIAPLVDRFWTSDTNDSLERQSIMRWTGVVVPPELLGSHLGAATAHTTGRTHALGFRFVTALFGHAGIEWDLTRLSEEDLAAVADWASLYRESRGLLHGGVTVRGDASDPALWTHGVVAADRSEAIFAYVSLASARDAVPAPIRLPGLDPDAEYAVAVEPRVPFPRTLQIRPPRWLTPAESAAPAVQDAGAVVPVSDPDQAMRDANDSPFDAAVSPADAGVEPVVLTGRILGELGLPAPLLAPEQALLLRVTRR